MATQEEKLPILRSKASSPTFRDAETDVEFRGDSEIAGSTMDGKIKVYWWRWTVLFVFVADLSVNNGIWITFGPIADAMRCYYSLSDFWINSVSMVYMVTYLLFIVPSVWIMARFGLRTTLVIAACFNALGACLRVAGVAHFWLLLTGQTVASLSNLLLWGGPSLVASIWFPTSERGIAAAIGGAFAPQLGVLTSYILGPLLVHSDDTNDVCSGNSSSDMRHAWMETIYNQLLYYISGQAGISLLLVIVTLVAVPTAPPTPPSRSQELVESSNTNQLNSLTKTLKHILTNGYFLLLLLTASINIGAAGAIVSLLDELIHAYFKDRDEDVVYIGLTALVCGFMAIMVTGIILSVTKAFYVMNVILYTISFLSIGGFLAALEFQTNFYILYPFVALTGASVIGFQALVYEYAAEMTYPLPEGTSGGLVNWVSQVVSILMIVVGPKFGTVNGHKVPLAWTIPALTLVGAIVTVFIRPDLRKTNIDTKKPAVTSSINSKPGI